MSSKTVTTLTISKMVDKDHRAVMTRLRHIFSKSGLNASEYENSYKNGSGASYPYYDLPVDLALWLILSFTSMEAEKLELISKLCKDTQVAIDALCGFDFSELPEEMFVYVARNSNTGNVKIGISKHPKERIKQLQVGCDGKLELLGIIPAPSKYKDEINYQTAAADCNIRSEWFTSTALFKLPRLTF